jgi:hypothetical protein
MIFCLKQKSIKSKNKKCELFELFEFLLLNHRALTSRRALPAKYANRLSSRKKKALIIIPSLWIMKGNKKNEISMHERP